MSTKSSRKISQVDGMVELRMRSNPVYYPSKVFLLFEKSILWNSCDCLKTRNGTSLT